MQLTNRSGVSLIELLLAIAIVVGVVIGLSLAFPKASQNTVQIQQRVVASNMAQTLLQTVKSRPYSFTDVTDSGLLDINCDCATVPDLTVLPSSSTTTSGTLFHTAQCVHFVSPGSPWTSQCLNPLDPASDTGYKHIVIYVYWTTNGQKYSTTQESMVTRF